MTSSSAVRPLGAIVADEAGYIRALLASLLCAYGFDVREASTWEEVLALLEAHADEIDAVLLSVELPGMGGLPALAALEERKPGLRCGLMSEDAEACAGCGADCVLARPFTLAQVQECARQLGGEVF